MDSLVGPHYLRFLDILKHLVLVFVIKGRYARQHLIRQNSKRPPVRRFAIAVSREHLGSDVLGCAAEGVRLIGKLSEAEVR